MKNQRVELDERAVVSWERRLRSSENFITAASALGCWLGVRIRISSSLR